MTLSFVAGSLSALCVHHWHVIGLVNRAVTKLWFVVDQKFVEAFLSARCALRGYNLIDFDFPVEVKIKNLRFFLQTPRRDAILIFMSNYRLKLGLYACVTLRRRRKRVLIVWFVDVGNCPIALANSRRHINQCWVMFLSQQLLRDSVGDRKISAVWILLDFFGPAAMHVMLLVDRFRVYLLLDVGEKFVVCLTTIKALKAVIEIDWLLFLGN